MNVDVSETRVISTAHSHQIDSVASLQPYRQRTKRRCVLTLFQIEANAKLSIRYLDKQYWSLLVTNLVCDVRQQELINVLLIALDQLCPVRNMLDAPVIMSPPPHFNCIQVATLVHADQHTYRNFFAGREANLCVHVGALHLQHLCTSPTPSKLPAHSAATAAG
eukprot:3247-Heterococcus_DN1.PRE.3